jgi:hypothetical protein
MIDHAWISIIAAVGAFSVSLLCIYLGYCLFFAGATGQFKFEASYKGMSVSLWSVAPGLVFAAFGAGVAIWAMYRLLPH